MSTLITATGHAGWLQLSAILKDFSRKCESLHSFLYISRLDLWVVVGGERGGAAVVLVKPFPAFTCLIPSPQPSTLTLVISSPSAGMKVSITEFNSHSPVNILLWILWRWIDWGLMKTLALVRVTRICHSPAVYIFISWICKTCGCLFVSLE